MAEAQSCTLVKISRPDPTRPTKAVTRPEPTRSPIHNGKSCKYCNELNVYSLLCAHTHECATQIRYASTRSRFHWLLIRPARMPPRRQLNTDQTPPLCSQINCPYYSLGANEKIASSFYVFCAPILLSIIALIAQRVMVRVSTVRIPP